MSQSHEAMNNALEGALRLAARRNADIRTWFASARTGNFRMPYGT